MVSLLVCAGADGQSLYPGQYVGKLKVSDAAPVKAEAFDLQDVRLLPGRFYTFIPKVLAEAREYELTGAPESRLAADFFWHEMVAHHTFAPGCSSDKEHFFASDM